MPHEFTISAHTHTHINIVYVMNIDVQTEYMGFLRLWYHHAAKKSYGSIFYQFMYAHTNSLDDIAYFHSSFCAIYVPVHDRTSIRKWIPVYKNAWDWITIQHGYVIILIMWYDLIYPYLSFHGAAVEVGKMINNVIPHLNSFDHFCILG